MRRMENQTVFWDHFRYTFFYTYYIFVSQTPSTSCRINFNLNFLPLFWEQRLVLSVSWNEEKNVYIRIYFTSIHLSRKGNFNLEWMKCKKIIKREEIIIRFPLVENAHDGRLYRNECNKLLQAFAFFSLIPSLMKTHNFSYRVYKSNHKSEILW